MEHSVPSGEASSDSPTSSPQSSNKSSFGTGSSSASASSQTSSSKQPGGSTTNPGHSHTQSKAFQAPVASPFHRHQSPTSMRPSLPLIPTPTRSIWTISICPTTGGQFQLCATPDETVDGLKKTIAKKLKLSKERITILFKDRVLKDGSLRENGIFEGCKLTLLPNIESGLMSQRPEHTVMQALESLSEVQVNDFLSGKSPLTLAMRLGDHMMFVQLQLSTSPPNTRRSSSSRSSSSTYTTPSLSSKSSSKSSTPASSPISRTSSPSVSPLSSVTTSPTIPTSLPTPPPSPSSPTMAMPLCSPTTSTSPLGMTPFMLPLTPSNPTPLSTTPLQKNITANCSTPSCSPSSSVSSSPSSSPNMSSSTDSVGSSPAQSPSSSSRSSLNAGPTPKRPKPTVAKPTPVNLENVPILDSSALAEASRNLSLKLKELSQASTVSREVTQTTSQTTVKNGAIIESMQHHGQGIYSGTFSGTLNPALQDRDGKPKRSISTIVHILNDLLGATPQYRAQLHARASGQQSHHQHQHTSNSPHRAHHHHHHHQHHHQHHHPKHTQQHHSIHQHQRLQRPGSPTERRDANVKAAGERLRLSQENRATRGKMEQIQQMLEERRQRRRARREARASPYTKSWGTGGHKLTPPASPHPSNPLEKTQEEQPMEVDANLEAASNMADGKVQEKGNYGELSQETVVA